MYLGELDFILIAKIDNLEKKMCHFIKNLCTVMPS